MIYKDTSSKAVIAKVYRNLNLKETERWVDMIEWIGEALSFIDAFPQFKQKNASIKVENYQGHLPCDFYQLQGMWSEGQAMFPATSMFGNTLISGSLNDVTTVDETWMYEKYEGLVTLESTSTFDSNPKRTFTIDCDYVRFNFQSGEVIMSYTGFAIDEEGFPMIPDHVTYTEACYWFIVKNLLYPRWLNGEIRDGQYVHAQNQWLKYCGQAGAKAMMPDLPKMENLKNQWVRLIKPINDAHTAFNFIGDQELIVRNK